MAGPEQSPSKRGAAPLPLLVLALVAGVAGAKGETETVEGCEVRFLRPKYVKDFGAQVSWSGACNKKGIAEGTGVLFYVDKDGDWARFVGQLVDGWASGDGDYRLTDGSRKVGTFAGNQIAEGRLYGPDGQLLFEGRFKDGAIDEGTYWIRDDLVAKGKFQPGARSVGDGGTGILHAAIQDAAGAVKYWLVGSTRYSDEASWRRAVDAENERLAAQRAAELEAEERRLAVERQRQAEEADRTYQAVAGALLGAAQAYNQQQMNALGAYQPPPAYVPPAPVYTPPAYVPPAPAYTPPAYSPPAPPAVKMHRPELDASSCVRLVQLAQGDPLSSYGSQVLSNQCGVTVEIFWCQVGGECERNGGNTWTVGAGNSWPVPAGQFRYAACRGKNSGGFDRGSQGMSYKCTGE